MGSKGKIWESNLLKGEGWRASNLYNLSLPTFEEFSNSFHLHLIDQNLLHGWPYSQGNLRNVFKVIISLIPKLFRRRKWEQKLSWQLPVFASLTKSRHDISKRKPQIDNKHQFGSICQRILFEKLANWPTTCVLSDYFEPRGIPPITLLLLLDDPPGVIQGGQENNRVCMDFPDPTQFTCYVAMKVVILVTYW